MIIDSRQYGGECVCGRGHEMSTKAAVIERGCLAGFESIMDDYGVGGKRCTLYGENSFDAVGALRPRAGQEIVLKSEGLHANEISTAEVLGKLDPDAEVIVAVGSGTIHDIARYCARERGIRFVSVPTAASVDGFCSTVAAMTWYGYKKTIPAVAPELVIADIDIIKAAPINMARSGVGDILAKYTALADWEISHVLTGEHLCRRIYGIMREAADTVAASATGVVRGDPEAYEHLTYALIMSGLAMQMMGSSRPASGGEHHISHLIEMHPAGLDVASDAMHGEKTGVGTVLVSEQYRRLAGHEDVSSLVRAPVALRRGDIERFFGEKLIGGVLEELEGDCLLGVKPEVLVEKWPEVRRIVSGIPESGKLFALLEGIDAKRTVEDIGVREEQKELLYKYSAMVRNRLTLMRLRRMLDI